MEQTQITISGFHAHVYYDVDSKVSAEKLHLLIKEQFNSRLLYWGKLIDRPVGPHPVPMFEIDFLPSIFTEVVTFLIQNHGRFSILIHPVTGNDLRDHTSYALWLGKQLSLDLSRL